MMGAPKKEDEYHMTLQEIADELGVIKQRVSQIIKSASAKVRKRAPMFKEFVEVHND